MNIALYAWKAICFDVPLKTIYAWYQPNKLRQPSRQIAQDM
jgi:hypothetical protein